MIQMDLFVLSFHLLRNCGEAIAGGKSCRHGCRSWDLIVHSGLRLRTESGNRDRQDIFKPFYMLIHGCPRGPAQFRVVLFTSSSRGGFRCALVDEPGAASAVATGLVLGVLQDFS